jgi:hypothetical protein
LRGRELRFSESVLSIFVGANEFGVRRGFASKVLKQAVIKGLGIRLTPKEFANSSPGFPTLGAWLVNILF